MLHLLQQQRVFAHSCHPYQIFFCFCEERRDHLVGRKRRHWLYREEVEWEELLIISLQLLQTYTRQSLDREQSHSRKAGAVVTQTLQIQTQLHMPSLPLRLGHTAGLAAPGLHSSSCPRAFISSSFLQMQSWERSKQQNWALLWHPYMY